MGELFVQVVGGEVDCVVFNLGGLDEFLLGENDVFFLLLELEGLNEELGKLVHKLLLLENQEIPENHHSEVEDEHILLVCLTGEDEALLLVVELVVAAQKVLRNAVLDFLAQTVPSDREAVGLLGVCLGESLADVDSSELFFFGGE